MCSKPILQLQPYSLDHTGFYFNSIETFEAGMKQLKQRGCEELEDLDESETQQISFLLDRGHRRSEVLERYEDVCLYAGSASDYAYELINETSEIPENLRCYIDYDAIARDMEINSEITEIKRELIVTNLQEF